MLMNIGLGAKLAYNTLHKKYHTRWEYGPDTCMSILYTISLSHQKYRHLYALICIDIVSTVMLYRLWGKDRGRQ